METGSIGYHKYRVQTAVMLRDIDAMFNKLKARFESESSKSPNLAKSIDNERKALEDFLYGKAIPGEIERTKKHYVFHYVAEYILKGKKRVLKKSAVGGSVAYSYRDWVIEAEAKHRFLLQLQPPNKFIKTKAENKINGSEGGKARGERNYRKFLEFIKDKSVDVSKYADVSPDNFATALNNLGFPISKVTASNYREKYLLTDKKDK